MVKTVSHGLDDVSLTLKPFTFNDNEPVGDMLDGLFAIADAEDEHIQRRVAHYARWSLAHGKPSHFEHFIFTSAPGTSAHSRTISFKPCSQHTVTVVIDDAKPIADSFFNAAVDKHLLDSVNDVVLISAAEPVGKPGPVVVYVNAAFEKMTGYTNEDIIGQTPRILQHENTDKAPLARIRKALENWEPVKEVVFNQKKNGEYFYAELDINPVMDETGWYTYWVAVQRDVTKQHVEEENRQRMLDAAPEAAICIDQNNIVTYFSQKAEYLWGLDRASVIGESLDILIPPEARESHRGYVASHREARTEPVCTNVTIRNRAGQERMCRMHIAHTVLSDGSIGYTIFARDHTEEIKKEAELERARKSNLMQSRLASLGELAAGVGHEINNPLQLIQGQLDLMTLQYRDLLENTPALAASFDTVTQACDRIKNIVANLRNMSRVNAEIDPNQVQEVTAICHQTVEMIESFHKNGRVRFDVSIPAEPIYARIDATSLSQILLNLVNNAFDAVADSTEKRVSLSVEAVDDTCLISVKDTGVGVSDEAREKVFDPFFTTKGVGAGTGLGLSIIHTLISAYGGEISFESEQGKGTRFIVRLLSSGNAQKSKTTGDVPALNVLIVDDEPGILTFLQSYLLHLGHRVVTTNNPTKALTLFEQEPFDLVITDYKMPVLTGDEMLAQMRASAVGRPFKAIMMSGYLEFEQDMNSKDPSQFSADVTMQKPFTFDDLKAELERLLA